jgi:hypothetical protein
LCFLSFARSRFDDFDAGGYVQADLKPGTARIKMMGKDTKVSVFCNYVHQGLLTFRDINRNLNMSISKADPALLKSFQESIRQFLSYKCNGGLTTASPTKKYCNRDKMLTGKTSKLLDSNLRKENNDSDTVLSKGQQNAVQLALRGESFFLTGGAGTGKSLVLSEIIKSLPAKTTFVTGS